ncbi:hypothetical protein Gogos_000926 [Gossypium gossypioides]|uniref:Uncharacterized protein n=1 Tax=Gossypium gossypioides TaxID=34282 RepID=A0A7J9CUR5_GOSGO|nr:hypothetical protein [Gossypium gossypioides]
MIVSSILYSHGSLPQPINILAFATSIIGYCIVLEPTIPST